MNKESKKVYYGCNDISVGSLAQVDRLVGGPREQGWVCMIQVYCWLEVPCGVMDFIYYTHRTCSQHTLAPFIGKSPVLWDIYVLPHIKPLYLAVHNVFMV